MASGIHAQITVSGVDDCPASAISEEHPIKSVEVNQRAPSESSTVVGEITVEHANETDPQFQTVDEVFDNYSETVYRYTHDETACPCVQVPNHGCPIRTLRVESGELQLSFISPNLETLREIVADLQSSCRRVSVRRLTRSGATSDEQSLLVIDRTAFTDRQYEVLQTAHDMGYFESPKNAKSETVADELGVSVATFVEHLSAAQTKLFDQIMSQ